jgi:hypothetical protein
MYDGQVQVAIQRHSDLKSARSHALAVILHHGEEGGTNRSPQLWRRRDADVWHERRRQRVCIQLQRLRLRTGVRRQRLACSSASSCLSEAPSDGPHA